MTVAIIKEKLIHYVEDLDDKKAEALYTLLEDDIEDHSSFSFTKEQLEILHEERELHMSGKTKSYSWEEAKGIITGKRDF
jgi:hypothetical protein